MARIIVTETASIDQACIPSRTWAKRAGVRTAIKFRSRFRTLYDRLTDHPASGPRRPALGSDIRIGIVTPYIVIYRYREDDGTVTVMRIVDGRRDITENLVTGTR
jgi:toxin ParE1/3/4